MSISKKLLGLSAGYVIYQVITNSKYDFFRKDIKTTIDKNKEKILEVLDSIDLLVSAPTEIGNEKNRLAIEQEINKIKQRLIEIETKKINEKSDNQPIK